MEAIGPAIAVVLPVSNKYAWKPAVEFQAFAPPPFTSTVLTVMVPSNGEVQLVLSVGVAVITMSSGFAVTSNVYTVVQASPLPAGVVPLVILTV